MSITLVTTAGSASANSYASVDDATAWFEGRLDVDAWDALNETQKERALLQGTLLLDALPIAAPKHGDNASTLRFPTHLSVDTSNALIIPTDVRDACCELALAWVKLSQQDLASMQAQRAAGLQSVSEGRVSYSFAQGATNATQQAIAQQCLAVAPIARALLCRKTVYNGYSGFLAGPGYRTVM